MNKDNKYEVQDIVEIIRNNTKRKFGRSVTKSARILSNLEQKISLLRDSVEDYLYKTFHSSMKELVNYSNDTDFIADDIVNYAIELKFEEQRIYFIQETAKILHNRVKDTKNNIRVGIEKLSNDKQIRDIPLGLAQRAASGTTTLDDSIYLLKNHSSAVLVRYEHVKPEINAIYEAALHGTTPKYYHLGKKILGADTEMKIIYPRKTKQDLDFYEKKITGR